jgi:hypothetical protein
MTSTVDCRRGANGLVTATTDVVLMPPGSAYPGGAGPGPFIADEVHGTCTVRGDGTRSASATVINGILETKYDPVTELPTETEPVPQSPPVNYTRTGTLDHVGDSYRIVFNEQTLRPDGSITVIAAHMYLLGPTAVGDMVIGHSTCGPLTIGPLRHSKIADFDGDNDTDRSVFRNGTWYTEGQATGFLGQTGDIPVPGDYDGDGDAEVGIWRPAVGGWYIAGQPTQWIGLEGDIPVPGDYDGNGTTDRAIWRPQVGGWYVSSQATKWIGLQGDVPVPGDYDGNGTTDRAVWRPGVGAWYVDAQTTAYLGAQGDVPLPLPYAIYRVFF